MPSSTFICHYHWEGGTSQDMFFESLCQIKIYFDSTNLYKLVFIFTPVIFLITCPGPRSLFCSTFPCFKTCGRSQPPMLMEMVHALHLAQPDDDWLVEVVEVQTFPRKSKSSTKRRNAHWLVGSGILNSWIILKTSHGLFGRLDFEGH